MNTLKRKKLGKNLHVENVAATVRAKTTTTTTHKVIRDLN
jgi:hypothetical protein